MASESGKDDMRVVASMDRNLLDTLASDDELKASSRDNAGEVATTRLSSGGCSYFSWSNHLYSLDAL